ncbi:uncharacterized protein CC84DRAFT_863389 [Paraphaeosphaeria sporulosa]|uniref:Uncharacterized protein n=1 Tax=Paraphaeosphaeria sporulosa TaxID=1460663 RepID=A0A177C8G8_9PLEO|nr:uncharacterized protein CC84DRAFT_863389 [Paraphaeosphaeria sporulosa]OAG03696.1 hypothetical protein CC84DRAFT_863389 [Paraphaeosphaeria sporulosa]
MWGRGAERSDPYALQTRPTTSMCEKFIHLLTTQLIIFVFQHRLAVIPLIHCFARVNISQHSNSAGTVQPSDIAPPRPSDFAGSS